MGLPPRDVPEGLTATEYYNLGIEYKKMGWTEQARDAMTLAAENAEDVQVADRARRFLKTKIPRFPVPLLAEQKNIKGFNLMAEGDAAAAKKMFEELIRDFPDFEWPYGNLSAIYLQEGKHGRAKELLRTALKVNPDYVTGWLRMAEAKGSEQDYQGALDCVKRALASDPSDKVALAMKEVLEKQNWSK
jgi:tetratricopeptide (TPR) repeat protein